MAEKQDIEILITEDGYITYHIKGIKGKKCVEVAKTLADPLGEIENMQLTSEYYEQEKKVKEITKQNVSQQVRPA
ncbi:MAG: DUF2997 domain-containing protein [bacterium]